MALIKCPECGQEISDTVKKCHHCGMKIKKVKQKKKLSKKKKIILSIAMILAFTAIGVGGYFLYQEVIVPMNKYDNAVKMIENGDYDNAIARFEQLGSYKDSPKMIKEATYQKAKKLVSKNEFDEALELFKELDGYEESETLIKETYYKRAIDAYNSQKYLEAKSDFKASGNYGDTATYLLKIEDLEKKDATEQAHKKNMERLERAYISVKDNSRVSFSSDKLSITVDSKDKNDFTSYFDILDIIICLGLPDSLRESMDHTNSMMGRQSETYNAWNVSWAYHPDNGLDVIFKLVE